jgi:hypothetical protein
MGSTNIFEGRLDLSASDKRIMVLLVDDQPMVAAFRTSICTIARMGLKRLIRRTGSSRV